MIFFDVLESIGVIITCIVAIWGINSWRKEARWKRKYELAEEVLAYAYESQQAIRFIRDPIGFQSEGSSRKIGDNETPEETKIYNQAYAVRERYNGNNTALKKLYSLKYRFIAIYGKEYAQHFDKFPQVIRKIFHASDLIAYVNLGKYGDDRVLNTKVLRENTAILYAAIVEKKEDKIEQEIQEAVDKIESICSNIIGNIRN